MDNTKLYLSHYANNLDKDLLLFPLKGMFVNLSTYLVTFNDIADTSKLKGILEFFAFQQVAAFKIGDIQTFTRIRKQMDVIIDSMWSMGNPGSGAINYSVNGASIQNNVAINDTKTALAKKSNIYVPNISVNSDKQLNISVEEDVKLNKQSNLYIPKDSLFDSAKYNQYMNSTAHVFGTERIYPNKLDILTTYSLSKNNVMDLFYGFDTHRINEIKNGTLNHTLFGTDKLQTITLLNSLQNSTITNDLNVLAQVVFSRYTVRHANLLKGLIATHTTRVHEIAYTELIILHALIRQGVKFSSFDVERVIHSLSKFTNPIALKNGQTSLSLLTLYEGTRYRRDAYKFNQLIAESYNPFMLSTLQWVDKELITKLGFSTPFNKLGIRDTKTFINESANLLWNSATRRTGEYIGTLIYGSGKSVYADLLNIGYFNDKAVTREGKVLRLMEGISQKSKYMAVDGMLKFSERLNKFIEKFKAEFNSKSVNHIDKFDTEFAIKQKPTYIPNINFYSRTRLTDIPTVQFGTRKHEVYVNDIEFMYKQLNTEMILFSAIDGKLNRKESILAGALLETAQWLTAYQINLQYSNTIQVDRNRNKGLGNALPYMPTTRYGSHPGAIQKTDKKMDKLKEYQDPTQPFGLVSSVNSIVLHNDGSTGAERYEKQGNPIDNMFTVTHNNKEGYTGNRIFGVSTNPKVGGAESDPFKLGTVNPKVGGAESDPFKLGTVNPKVGGAESEPFKLGTINPKVGGAESEPFVLSEKGHTKIGGELTSSLWAHTTQKYSTIHASYTLMDNCLKECTKIYDYLTTDHFNKVLISESLNFTWCSINSKSSEIHDNWIRTTTNPKVVQNHSTEFLTTKQRIELFKANNKIDFADKFDRDTIVRDDTSTDTKSDRDLVLNESTYESFKYDRNINLELTTHETAKNEKPIEVVDKRTLTTKQLRELFLQEQQAKLEKQDSDIIVLNDITEIEKLDDNIVINSMSYVIEKNPADITMGDIFMALKGNTDIYIPLNTSIPMEQAYKTITLLNDIIAVDKNFCSIHLEDIKMLYKAKPDIILLDSDLNGMPFDKYEKSVILNSSDDVPYIKDDRDILLIDTLIPADILRRWYFLPDTGPYDRLVLPLDYPYKEHPIKGVVTGDSAGSSYPFTAKDERKLAIEHPIPQGWDQGIEEIDVSIAIMANIIDYGYVLKDTYKQVYERYTPSQSIKHFVNLFYQWLNDYVPDVSYHVPGYVMTDPSNNPEIYRDDYWRLYRWIRWHAEAIIQNLSDAELNILDGNAHIDLLLNQLIRYFNDHHGIYAKDGKYTLDKVKGVRHRWLSRYNKF